MSPDRPIPKEFTDIWVYLESTPLLGLTITLAAYIAGDWIYKKSGQKPIFNPVLLAVLMLTGFLTLSGLEYQTYFEGAKFVHFLLGPATVALAIPLYKQFQKVKKSALGLMVALIAGSVTAAGSAVGIAWALGASKGTLLALAPKSVTAPVAMGISESLGGSPSLTAVLVILTGITGAALGTYALNAAGVKDWKARGFAMGVASHGIGTARALQVNETAGAFAGLAMGLNALATAILLPILWGVFF